MKRVACLGLIVCTGAFAGTAYRSVGPDGSVVFSDRPTPNAEEVRLPEPSTYAPPALRARTDAPAFTGTPGPAELYDSIRVTAPPDDGTVFAAQGGVDIDVALDPPLMDGHTLSYIVDGREMAKGLRTTRIRITDLDRGTHHLEVAVRDQDGRILARSARITFHLRQSSLNDPQRPDGDGGEPDDDKPPKDPTYKPERPGAPPYVPAKPSVPPYVPPAIKPPYQPPAPGTRPYAPPARAPSYAPPPPARAPYAPSFTPK